MFILHIALSNLSNASSCSSASVIRVICRSLRSVNDAFFSSGKRSRNFRISGARLRRFKVWVTRARESPKCRAMSALVCMSGSVKRSRIARACSNALMFSFDLGSQSVGGNNSESSSPYANKSIPLAWVVAEKNCTSTKFVKDSDPGSQRTYELLGSFQRYRKAVMN